MIHTNTDKDRLYRSSIDGNEINSDNIEVVTVKPDLEVGGSGGVDDAPYVVMRQYAQFRMLCHLPGICHLHL